MKTARQGAPDHRLVAEVITVEIAEGDDAAPESVRNAAGES